MKILVTGVTGQLGYDCVKQLELDGDEVQGVSSKEFPLTEPLKMEAYLRKFKPEAVIHCAAYTAVDKAEDEPEACRAVNAEGTRNLSRLCREIDAKLIYISTDYVFPGTGEEPYAEDAPAAPVNVYGASKWEGETAVRELLTKYFIVRISWVFGYNGRNFIRTMLWMTRWARLPTPAIWQCSCRRWQGLISTAPTMPPTRASAPGQTWLSRPSDRQGSRWKWSGSLPTSSPPRPPAHTIPA